MMSPQAEITALKLQRAQLIQALTHLVNEAGGSMHLPGVREAIGNTNMQCLELRVSEARLLLDDFL